MEYYSSSIEFYHHHQNHQEEEYHSTINTYRQSFDLAYCGAGQTPGYPAPTSQPECLYYNTDILINCVIGIIDRLLIISSYIILYCFPKDG